MLKNRKEAGILLSNKVQKILTEQFSCKPFNLIVVGLPRGGVPVACEIALQLDAPLTVLVSKKISAPIQPELAVGAISSSGVMVLNDELSYLIKEVPEYIENEKRRLTKTTKDLEKYWIEKAGIKNNIDFKDKIVVLADDGVATGMTTMAALKSLRLLGASHIILATPVIASDVYNWLQLECDCIISLLAPINLGSVGQFYSDFEQVEDEEVVSILKECFLKTAQKID